MLVDNDAKENTGNTHTDNAGQEAKGIDSIMGYKYNVKGETVQIDYNLDASTDGSVDKVEYQIRNANGFMTRKEVDVTNNNSIDTIYTYTLNEKGQAIEQQTIYRKDGVDTLAQREVYELNVDGTQKRMTRYVADKTTPTVVETYEYNAKGEKIKVLYDNAGDGSIERADIYTLDNSGRIILSQNDVGNNGSIESQRKYERDAVGNLLVEYIDNNNDNTFETKNVFKRDVYGNEIQKDIYVDGQLTQISYRTFDAYGRQIGEIIDRDGKGLGTVAGDRDERYEMSYNVFGQQETVKSYVQITEQDKVGKYDFTATRVFDDRGRVTVETVERPNAEPVITHYKYGDLWGNSIENLVYNSQNQLTHRIEFVLNQNGDTILSYQDNNIARPGFEILDFGRNGGYYTVNHKEDLTKWSSEQLTKVKGVLNVFLSREANQSEIVLDKDVVKKIAASDSNNTLWIRGDATDMVSFKNDQSQFQLTKGVEVADKTFDQYTFNEGGVDYHLRIANDIEVNFGVVG